MWVFLVYINQEPGERTSHGGEEGKSTKKTSHDMCWEEITEMKEKNNTEWFFWTAAEQVG